MSRRWERAKPESADRLTRKRTPGCPAPTSHDVPAYRHNLAAKPEWYVGSVHSGSTFYGVSSLERTLAAFTRPALLDASRAVSDAVVASTRQAAAAQASNDALAAAIRPTLLSSSQAIADAVAAFALPALAAQAMSDTVAGFTRPGWMQLAALGGQAAMLDVAEQRLLDRTPSEANAGDSAWWVARLPPGVRFGIVLALLTMLLELSVAVEDAAGSQVPEAAELAPGLALAVVTLVHALREARKYLE